MIKAKQQIHWSLLLLITFVGGLVACSKTADTISLSGSTMGTTYNVKLVSNNKVPDLDTLHAEIDLVLEQVNDQMSTYRPDSELSTYNRLLNGQGMKVSPDTITVVSEAKRLNELTDGALNVTVGPLINLWGFGPGKRRVEPPVQSEIDAAKAMMNISAVMIDGNRLIKGSDDLYVDLSAIAKGFGVDKIASILNKYDVTGYLVEIGGELKSKGTKADGSTWKVAIEKPTTDERKVQQIVSLKDMAMATSGDYRNYFEKDGKRFAHIVDPRSGFPIQHTLASVTVLHDDCMVADGLATAMMVMGTKDALKLAKQQELAIMLIEKQGDGFKVIYSDAFKPFITE
ncbi:FAD:protein FMN transferase [Parashewanella spongiae]|uniref:FAD:protein FMN transferase n=1 Tax=Parashewanella spongiae TaxID=342950 RepID=A0A3A6U6B6_9GAMM|nr:FAD:protein FMN transferase [Parashewanella spongiae]MCL1078870.1 FAD:protein FMN transferase [Parashewanella spongiae]RJY11845.1 FAD:protein FMN transferase [Parashewanella spongiae]